MVKIESILFHLTILTLERKKKETTRVHQVCLKIVENAIKTYTKINTTFEDF